MAMKWYCDACGNEVPREFEDWHINVSTQEGPVTVVLSAGYGNPSRNDGFQPGANGAAICKRCILLALQSEFAMEDAGERKRKEVEK